MTSLNQVLKEKQSETINVKKKKSSLKIFYVSQITETDSTGN